MMPRSAGGELAPGLCRLATLTALDAPARAALDAAIEHARPVRAHAELLREGRAVGGARLMVAGWAARVRVLPDGRRQLLSFVLPGDLIGHCQHAHPLASSSIVALTPALVAAAPDADALPALAEAYALSRALDEAHLLAHITRLGRMNAQDRIIDLLLELHERLSLAGMTSGDSFELPLTQELLADTLGLTAVHINRMIQQLRRGNSLEWRGRWVTLTSPAGLTRALRRTAVRISERQAAP